MRHQRSAASGASDQANGNGTSPHSAAGEVAPTTTRAAAARGTASSGVRRSDAIWITECAWCKRVRNVRGDWLRLAAVARAALPPERTHGICPECADACLARANELPDPWAK
jgi:hypothetical protein